VAVDEHRAAGLTMPQMMLISVVLPAPFGPSSAKISPRGFEVDVLQRRRALEERALVDSAATFTNYPACEYSDAGHSE
jgi:hypothetical protein